MKTITINHQNNVERILEEFYIDPDNIIEGTPAIKNVRNGNKEIMYGRYYIYYDKQINIAYFDVYEDAHG